MLPFRGGIPKLEIGDEGHWVHRSQLEGAAAAAGTDVTSRRSFAGARDGESGSVCGLVSAALISALTMLIAAGCSPQSDYPVQELRDRNLRILEESVFWLDDQTVAFLAQTAADRADQNPDDPVAIYLWKPGAGDEQLYRPAVWPDELTALRSYFCASDGRLIYNNGTPQAGEPLGGVRFSVLKGPPGREVADEVVSYFLRGGVSVEAAPHGLLPSNHVWSVFGRKSGVACKENIDPEMVGKTWAQTHSPNHYIWFERDAENYVYSHAFLFDKTTRRTIPIETTGGEISPSCVLTTPWDGATWIWACRSRPRPGAGVPEAKPALWRVDLGTGAVRAIDIPIAGAALILSPAPTARGFLFYGSTDERHDGLFRFVGNEQEQLVPGRFRSASTSPDGCRVALSQAASSFPDDNRLVVVDVCAPN